jgi:hypothetical protein
MELDEVMVNLKVIASISVNTKLYTSGTMLNIEQPGYIPEGLRRWYRQDNRDEAIKKIDRTISKVPSLLLALPSNENILQSLEGAKVGLQNMAETYSSCVQTSARIGNLIDKIDTLLATHRPTPNAQLVTQNVTEKSTQVEQPKSVIINDTSVNKGTP